MLASIQSDNAMRGGGIRARSERVRMVAVTCTCTGRLRLELQGSVKLLPHAIEQDGCGHRRGTQPMPDCMTPLLLANRRRALPGTSVRLLCCRLVPCCKRRHPPQRPQLSRSNLRPPACSRSKLPHLRCLEWWPLCSLVDRSSNRYQVPRCWNRADFRCGSNPEKLNVSICFLLFIQ
jgi:hypothetical protein